MYSDSSFDEIYEQLFPVIYRFVSMRVPQSDIEDITSETMAKVWKALPQFEGKSSIQSWALRIAFNQVADFYRARKHTSITPLSEIIENQKPEADHSEQLTTWLSVGQALEKLSVPQVTVIQLRLVEGFSAAEVADILGITQQAVDSLLYRAKKSFRKIYGSEGMGGNGR